MNVNYNEKSLGFFFFLHAHFYHFLQSTFLLYMYFKPLSMMFLPQFSWKVTKPSSFWFLVIIIIFVVNIFSTTFQMCSFYSSSVHGNVWTESRNELCTFLSHHKDYVKYLSWKNPNLLVCRFRTFHTALCTCRITGRLFTCTYNQMQSYCFGLYV